MKTKSISYAYPTSTTATRRGYKQSGCYYVTIHNGTSLFDTKDCHETFKSKEAAVRAAETMPEPWHPKYPNNTAHYLRP